MSRSPLDPAAVLDAVLRTAAGDETTLRAELVRDGRRGPLVAAFVRHFG